MKIKPTKGQLEFLNWEIGTFFHFGIRTFYPNHVDWDNKEMSAEAFCPRNLDCEQWARVAKSMGATYAILTTKHHDGFALWPSKYTEFSVKNTPWKDQKGDVVREFVDACRKYGLKVGLYYSPAQWGGSGVRFQNGKEYDDYFINQISELLSGYGKIDYLWFDGCGSEGHKYDYKRIVGEILRLQPEILTFCDPEWYPCVRWVGNEDGYAQLNNPLVVESWDFSVLTEDGVGLSKANFLPAECDCKLRDTWFYEDNEDTIKSLDELLGMYEASVGRGSNFLLNVGPNEDGLIPAADAKRLQELGEKISECYGTPLPFDELVQEDENTHSITYHGFEPKDGYQHRQPVNTLILEEDLTDGQGIKEFQIYAYLPRNTHRKVLIYRGYTVGHKMICRFPTVCSPKLTVEVLSADGEYRLQSVRAYFVK